MTEATAIPINVYENEHELLLTAPMPGVEPEDIGIEVTDDGRLTVAAEEHGIGQERIAYLRREWSYGPYRRTIELPCAVDAQSANATYGNGVLHLSLPKTGATAGAEIRVDRTGHARGVSLGHAGHGHGEPAG